MLTDLDSVSRAENDDDGCPHGDPECLGHNGDCHDACSTFAERRAVLRIADASVMPASSVRRTEWYMALSAVVSGNAATLDIAEAMRGDMPIGENLRHRETAEQMADALRSVLALLHGSPPPFELVEQRGRYDDGCRLLVAVQDYLEGWES